MARYRIFKKKNTKSYFKWRIICKTPRCGYPWIPKAYVFSDAIALMDNHEFVWHTPSNNTTKENSNV